MQDSWFEDPMCMAAMTNNVILNSWKTDKYYFNNVTDPHVLEARVNNQDTMRTILHLTLPLAVPSKHNSGKQ